MSNSREVERTIHLVNPRTPTIKLTFAGKSFGVPAGLGVVGSMVEKVAEKEGFAKEVDIKVIEEDLGEVCDPKSGDLVLATSFSLNSKRVEELTRQAKKRGASVVVGGIHATQVPNDFAKEGAISFRGEAGNSERFSRLMHDWLHSGKIQEGTILDSEGVDNPRAISLVGLPVSKKVYGQLDRKRFIKATFATSGCPYECDFCTVVGGRIVRTRPVEDVVGEIKVRGLDKSGFVFADSNLAASPDNYLYSLLDGLASLKIPNGWATELSINLIDRGRDRLYDALKEAHCQKLYVGFESPNPTNLQNVGKKHNVDYTDPRVVREIVEKLHRRGIKVVGLFIVGFLTDTPESIRSLEAFIKNSKIDDAMINKMTPLPGTKIWQQFAQQGLFDPQTLNTDDLDFRHFVFRHPLGNDVLEQEFKRLSGRVFAIPTVMSRSLRATVISVVHNVPESRERQIRNTIVAGLVQADLHRNNGEMLRKAATVFDATIGRVANRKSPSN